MGEFIALTRGNNIFGLHILTQHNTRKGKKNNIKYPLIWLGVWN